MSGSLSYLMHNAFWKSVEAGEWEPYTFEVLDRFVTSETNVIDIGAWIGPVTLYASKTAKHVYAVEPDPVAFNQLSAISYGSNVTIFKEAILDGGGVVSLGSTDGLGASTTRINCDSNAFNSRCSSLSEFVKAHSIPDPIFIKMDVEGAEELILESPFFEARRPVLYVSVHHPLYLNPSRVEARLSELRKVYNRCEVVADGNYGALLFS